MIVIHSFVDKWLCLQRYKKYHNRTGVVFLAPSYPLLADKQKRGDLKVILSRQADCQPADQNKGISQQGNNQKSRLKVIHGRGSTVPRGNDCPFCI